jgi:hypothetical protein
MKTGWVLVLSFVAVLTGCNPHYHRIEGDRLHMYLDQPDAQRVELRCDFDGFQKRAAQKNDDGLWEVSLPFTHDFKYFYKVDGKVFLPPCRYKEMDDFGSKNCILLPDM